MRQSIRSTLLITSILVLVSCRSNVVKAGFEAENIDFVFDPASRKRTAVYSNNQG